MTQHPETSDPLRRDLEHHAAALRQYFRRRVGGHPAEIDDLVQEVFVRLLNRRPEAPIENLEGYVFQIAANLLRERGRRFSRQIAVGAPFLTAGLLEGDEDFSAERVHAARDAWALIERGLQELPERVRNVFVLNRFEEMTGVQIARHLGVSVSTVEKDMIRAILHLKERLK
jgi:RNA polymerase sigma-70 factor (ECF subfamily)